MTTVIRDVYYMPDLDGNLLYIFYLAEDPRQKEVVGKGYKKNSLYLLAAMPCLKKQTAYVVNGPSVFLNPKLPLTALASQKMSSEADINIWHH